MKPYREHLADMRAIKLRELMAKYQAREPSMLKLVEIIVPVKDTAESHTLHGLFQRWLCDVFGGFTQYKVTGSWKDPKTSVQWDDDSVAYRVAGKANAGGLMAARCQELWPDERAWFIANLGEAYILQAHNRSV